MTRFPKPILKADFDSGEGDIVNLERWREEVNPTMRLDILLDWGFILEREIERTHDEVYPKKGKTNEPS